MRVVKMSFKKTLTTLVLAGAMTLGLATKVNATPILYDDFSAPILNSAKWDIKQDVEGQPLMDESYLDTNLQNFHMQHDSTGNERTYLVPKRQFTTGDIIEYESNVISHEGNYMNMVLLTGSQNWRIGINGYVGGPQGFDELGITKVRMEFQENNLALRRESPSGNVFFDNLPLSNSNGNYKVYMGAVSDYKTHMDFDNFYTDTIPEPTTMSLLGLGALTLLRKRKKKSK